MLTLLAALPILVILLLMLAARWPASRAGLVGLLLAVALAAGFFLSAGGRLALPQVVGGAMIEAVFTSFAILWIIFPALLIFHLQRESGAMGTLRRWITGLSDDPRISTLLVAWFFGLFVEGAAGFGTPTALAAPFLLTLGFSPVAAVIIVQTAHSIGVSFGAVGTPVVPLMEATGYSGVEIAGAIGTYHGLLGGIMVFFLGLIISRNSEFRQSNRAFWLWCALAAVTFLLPYYLISRFIGPELPTLGSALTGGLVFIGLLKASRRRSNRLIPRRDPGMEDPLAMPLWKAAVPYLALITLVLLTRLVAPIQGLATSLNWEWSLWEQFGGSFRPLYQPGTLLFISAAAGALAQRLSPRLVRRALMITIRQTFTVALALLAMLGLSRMMVHSGMISQLAAGMAELTGVAYPLFSPFVGVLGAFVTGSATASNILFAEFQFATANALNIPPLPVMGVQGLGAAAGNLISPQNIIAGSATVDAVGQESAILRGTLPVCLVYATAGGLLALLLAS